jgi:hypothetical protein
MSRFIFKIIDTFWMERIGLLAASDANAQEVSLGVGERIELRLPDGSRFETEVAGIPRLRNLSYDPDRHFEFLLPTGLRKDDVPLGTEVWVP